MWLKHAGITGLLGLSTLTYGLDLSEKILPQVVTDAEYNIGIVVDNSDTMNITLTAPDGNVYTRYNYYRDVIFPKLFSTMRNANFVMAPSNAVVYHGQAPNSPAFQSEFAAAQQIASVPDTGSRVNGNDPAFTTMIQDFYNGTKLQNKTFNLHALAKAGNFMTCLQGNTAAFVDPNLIYNCWAERQTDIDAAGRCVKNQLWLFSDGMYDAVMDRNEIHPASKLGSDRIQPIFGQSGYTNLEMDNILTGFGINHDTDGIYNADTSTGDGKGEIRDHHFEEFTAHTAGMADVATFIINQANANDIKLEFNYVAVGDESGIMIQGGGDGIADKNEYKMGGPTGPNGGNMTFQWLEHMCATHSNLAGLGYGYTCSRTKGSPQWNYQWSFMGNTFQTTENAFSASTPWIFQNTVGSGQSHQKAKILDHALMAWHFNEAKMLGVPPFINDPEYLEANLPSLSSSFNATKAIPSYGGLAVNGTEYEPAEDVFQPLFHQATGDVFHFQIDPVVPEVVDDGDFVGHASDNVPQGTDREVWSWNGDADESEKIPEATATDAEVLSWGQRVFSRHGGDVAKYRDLLERIYGSLLPKGWLRVLFDDYAYAPPDDLGAIPPTIGDIVNSRPVVVGKPFFKKRENKAAYVGAPSYQSFKTNAPVVNRPPMLYVGSNAGFLHGMKIDDDANTGNDATTLAEVFAYLPSNRLLESDPLLDPTHTHMFDDTQNPSYEHKFGVDLTPIVQDVVLNSSLCPSGITPCWRTVLAGGLRRGGRGYFMIDVTDPTIYDNETTGSQGIMWEFSYFDPDGQELGYSFAEPRVNPSYWKDGTRPRAIMAFGNGVNSDNSQAHFYALAIEKTSATGHVWSSTNVKRIDLHSGAKTTTPSSAPDNGLLSCTAVDMNDDDLIDYYYCGDLVGNLWRINATDPDPDEWTATRIFTLGDNDTNYGIASAPMVTKASDGRSGLMISFGTGHHYNETQLDPSNAASGVEHAVYGIWDEDPDNTGVAPITVSNLEDQRFKYGGSASTRSFHPSSASAPSYPGQKGWRVLLREGNGNGPSSYAGERITSLSMFQNVLVATSHAVKLVGSGSGGQCGGITFPGYISLFDPNNGGAELDYERFAFGAVYDNSAEGGEVGGQIISSIRLESAPSALSFTNKGTVYFQDGDKKIQSITLEGTAPREDGQRLSWTRIADR